MIIEGKNAVFEAIKAGKTCERLVVQKGLSDIMSNKIIDAARAAEIKIQFVDKQVLDRESVTRLHQGFIASVCDFKYSTVEELLEYAKSRGEPPFLVIADGIEDPHNLGSIIRVSECSGAHGLIIPRHRAVGVNETVARVSCGASEHLKIAKTHSVNFAIEQLKKAGVWVYCADMDGQDLYGTKFSGALAFVIGGEDAGVKPLTKKLCDVSVKIPMFGRINSLNASVACAVVLYEAVRQRCAT
jgi:23S rRNA (guanosine2251-2'-O)-methyltransferase